MTHRLASAGRVVKASSSLSEDWVRRLRAMFEAAQAKLAVPAK